MFGKSNQRISPKNGSDARPAYERVDVRFTEHYTFKAKTIPDLVGLSFAENDPEKATLGYRKVLANDPAGHCTLDNYCWLTRGQVGEMITQLAGSFLFYGVTFQERVLIYAETSPEWFLCAQSLWRIGATVATLFANLGLEGILHGIRETAVEHLITTRDLLPDLLLLLPQLPNVRLIYVIEPHLKVCPVQVDQSDFAPVKLINYETLLNQGHSVSEEEMTKRLPRAEDIAVVMYTSGSTGTPKGVLLSHGNFVSACQAVFSAFGGRIISKAAEQTYYAFLPLAHVFELASEVGSFGAGFTIGYGHATTMVDGSPGLSPGSPGDLTLLRPTLMSTVPLLLERIRMKLQRDVSSSWPKQVLLRALLQYKTFWRYFSLDTPLLNRFICTKAQALLGGKVQAMIVAGAHLNVETQELIQHLFNIRLLVGFGATETCAASFLSDYDDYSLGSTSLLHGNTFRLIACSTGGYSPDHRPNPRGELLIGGPSVAQGYLGKPQLTAEAFEVDDQGCRWFRTGDIVELLPGNRIQVLDRKRDLVKLQNGEFVSLGKVEAALKGLSLIEHVALFSSLQSNYLVALFAVNEGALRELRELANQIRGGSEQEARPSLETLCQSRDIQEAFSRPLESFCRQTSLSPREIPRHFHLCSQEWTVQSGLLTGTLKINRDKIAAAYRDTLQTLFQ